MLEHPAHVHENWRRRGVGRQVGAAALSHCRDRGWWHAKSDVEHHDRSARAARDEQPALERAERQRAIGMHGPGRAPRGRVHATRHVERDDGGAHRTAAVEPRDRVGDRARRRAERTRSQNAVDDDFLSAMRFPALDHGERRSLLGDRIRRSGVRDFHHTHANARGGERTGDDPRVTAVVATAGIHDDAAVQAVLVAPRDLCCREQPGRAHQGARRNAARHCRRVAGGGLGGSSDHHSWRREWKTAARERAAAGAIRLAGVWHQEECASRAQG